jgi:hypothetical protein
MSCSKVVLYYFDWAGNLFVREEKRDGAVVKIHSHPYKRVNNIE